MLVSLTVVRYSFWGIPFGFFSMALFRLPLGLNPRVRFWKLMGCGKNGTFDITPDLAQWGLMAVWDTRDDFEQFRQRSWVSRYWRIFAEAESTILCQPFDSHGLWDGKEPFGKPNIAPPAGRVAVLTRATIRWSRLRNFWKNVPTVAATMDQAPGFVTSVGIGEAPFVRQATFSIWESLDDVKQFAYRQRQHAEVIRKTRQENWYSEDLFARFSILETWGDLWQKRS
jgi:heme-degrading monooxygenase HmoA